jgi:hypothetical protein
LATISPAILLVADGDTEPGSPSSLNSIRPQMAFSNSGTPSAASLLGLSLLGLSVLRSRSSWWQVGR